MHKQINDDNLYDGFYLDNQQTNRGVAKKKKLFTHACVV